MFERIVRNIVPPEMAALLLPVTTSPKVRGYLFRKIDTDLYYSRFGTVTVLRDHARIYSPEQVQIASRNHWNWGHKSHGSWVVVYA
jgi:hypothetical protein